jgi:4-amino-4-deoxy-L-arabinose transferase-like glycosyltransferase
VPVAAFWTASLLLAARGSAGGAIGAGLAAGIAVLIRPNIVPLAAVPMLIVLWRAADVPLRARIRRAAAFALACAPFALFIGWLFNDLYGSPLQSGYGDHKGLFSASFVPQNLATYPRWLLETQTPLILLFVASPFIAAAGSRFLRGALLAFVVLIAACYLFYLPFEAWWYLRFLLPAFPLMFILAADVVARVAARLGGQWKTAALASFATIMVAFGAYQAHQRFAFAIRAGEKKYEDVGKHVATTLPGNAVVYAMQHSGSIRYYSGRLTLRHDRLSPGWLDFSVEHLRKLGYEPFFVLDDWEVEDFLKKFPGQKYAALVEKEPPNAACTHTTYLYRVVEQWSTRVPQYSGCR